MSDFLSSPTLWVAMSLLIYMGSKRIYRRAGTPLLHPVLLTIVALITLLVLLRIDYETYNRGGSIISFFLGPSVVALGVPLAEKIRELREQAPALLLTIGVGAFAGVVSAVLPLVFFGVDSTIIASMAPKSVTTPIAMSIAEGQGGEPSLTAAFVVMTGIFGAVVGPTVMKILKVDDELARGFALGAAAHGIGTARALEEGRTSGAAGSLAICLNGIATSIITPPILSLVFSLWELTAS